MTALTAPRAFDVRKTLTADYRNARTGYAEKQ